MRRLKSFVVALSIILLAGVLCAGLVGKRAPEPRQSLAERAMAGIVGGEKWYGYTCAQCIDGCEQVGSQEDCTEEVECDFGNGDDDNTYKDGWTGDWISCNGLFSDTSTPGVSIAFCSRDPSAGRIYCREHGTEKTCGNWEMCWCVEDAEGDHCKYQNVGTYSDNDHCD